MSLQQFGYSYSTTATSLASPQLLMPSSSPVTTPSGGSGGITGAPPGIVSGSVNGVAGCCDGGRILGTNPHTGQPVCSCQYGSGLLTYSRMAAGLSESVYSGSPYTTPGYVPLGTDPSAFYPPLTSTYDIKEAGDTWRGIGQPTACYPYDPTGMATYPYTNAYGAMDINSAARRKNATRENTNTLKAWLYEHRKNPYPTKGEKIMLAIITKMTLTQVSTWFANARRRLKKENKMTWSPRNRSGDTDGDGDDDDEDDDKNKEDSEDKEDKKEKVKDDDSATNDDKGCLLSNLQGIEKVTPPQRLFEENDHSPVNNNLPGHHHPHHPPQLSGTLHHHPSQQQHSPRDGAGFMGLASPSLQQFPGMTSPVAAGLTSQLEDKRPDSLCSNSNDSGLSDVNCNYSAENLGVTAGLDATGGFRPKIWSLAHVATSDNSSSPYLNSVSASSSASGSRSASGMLSRSPVLENSKSLPPGMQGWGNGPPYASALPRSSSFGLNTMMNNHYKVSAPSSMFSHPLSSMTAGLASSGGGYSQLSSLYPHPKLSVD